MQHPAPATVSTSPPAKMRASLLSAWQQAQPAQRLGYLVGGALILVGLGQLAGWLVVGGAWAGPVSLRKPTTFGISFGLATITLAWVTGHLRITDRTRWLLLGPLTAATSYEVAWVSIQHAHFNDTTPLDERLFVAGAVMVAIAIAGLLAGLLSLSGQSQRRQTQLVAVAVVGYAGLFGVALGRTSSGLGPVAPLLSKVGAT